MDRRHLIGLIGSILVGTSGCQGFPGQSDFCQYDTVTPIPTPEMPESLTQDSATEFVVEYERARYYQLEAGRQANASIRVTVEAANRTDEGWMITLGGGIGIETCNGRGHGPITTKYFLNDNAVYREERGGTSVDPRNNGTRVLKR